MAFDTLINLGMIVDLSDDARPQGQLTFDAATPRPVRFNNVNHQTYKVWGEAVISPVFNTFTGQTTGRIFLGTALYRVHYNPIIMALRYMLNAEQAWVRATGYAGWDVAIVRDFVYDIENMSVSSDGRYIQIDLNDGRSLNE